MTKKIIFAGEI